jgi:hypothetical protein
MTVTTRKSQSTTKAHSTGGAAEAKATKKSKASAKSVQAKAKSTRPKTTQTSSKAAAKVLGEKKETITFRLPPGARVVENPELPDFLKGTGARVKASVVFDVPVSLSIGKPTEKTPGPETFTSYIRSAVQGGAYGGDVKAFKADLGNYGTISDAAVADVKSTLASALGFKQNFSLDYNRTTGATWDDCDIYPGKGVCFVFPDGKKAEMNLETGEMYWGSRAGAARGSVVDFLASNPSYAA